VQSQARHVSALGALVASALALGSCASQPAPATSSDDFASLVDTYLNGASAEEFSEEQIEVLKQARAAGALDFEDYAAAIDRSLECIDAAGFYTEADPVDHSRGFPTIGYFYESPESGNPVAEACIVEHSGAIESVYQLQPQSVEAEDSQFGEDLAALESCLKDKGISAEPAGLEGRDLYREFNRMLMNEVEEGGPPGPVATCFGTAE
jgi:hypothetical protein